MTEELLELWLLLTLIRLMRKTYTEERALPMHEQPDLGGES
jgi:hypothetical protein